MSPPSRGSRDHDLVPLGRGRRQRARRRKRVSRRRRVGLLATLAIIAFALLLVTVGFGGAIAYRAGCSLSSLRPIPLGSNTFIYAADGSRLGSIPSERNRQPVPWSRISPWLTKSTVAIEDKRFWQHGGVDPIGMTRALWADLRAGKVVQGGSTITQQLVRNLYISRERTFTRKLREACLAEKLAHKWTKKHILTSYLNQVYYGSQAYGVEAAAQTYFSKHADSLSLPQAALLAGLPQAPSQYDPVRDPDAAISRRNEVLRALLDTNQITPAEYRWARHVPLHLKVSRLYKRIWQPYFFGYVRDQLRRVYGERRVESGGLRVYTTIDPRLQRAAGKAIHDTLYDPNDPAAAAVAINPANGAIRAMTSVDPARKHNQFNLIAQAHRQAGSTFKTFVLAAAIQAGIDPETTDYLSAPLHCDTGPCAVSPWDVSTYDHTYVGGTSIASATLRSDNTVYARLTLDLGADKVAAMARKLGVRTQLGIKTRFGLAYVPAMGLGAIAVTPLDMASAYATLAAGGVYSTPMAITKVILPNGREDTKSGWGKPEHRRVISAAIAYEVTKILQENVQYGTGVGANFGKPAAGKTGTTDNHADAWFCGYTPQLAATIWVGYSRAEVPMLNVHGIAVAGGTFPATIWHLFMQTALANAPTRDFIVPPTQPTYTYWHGEWQWSGGYYTPPPTYTPSYTTTAAATTTAATTTAAAAKTTGPPPGRIP